MRTVIKILLIQEFYYGIFLVIIGISVGIQNDLMSGLRAFLYCFILFQFIIFWINRKIIKTAFWPEIKDKKLK